MPLEVPQKVIDYVGKKKFATVDDLVERFGFTRLTAQNYLSRLKKRGIVSRVGYGRYRFEAQPLSPGLSVAESDRYLFEDYRSAPPSLVERVKSIVDVIRARMPFVEFSVWSTENLAEFSHYAIGKDVVFIEAERGVSKKIREVLLEKNIRSLIEPSGGELMDIFIQMEAPLVIFRRKETYATIKKEGVRIPLLERMMVDLYFYITRLEFPFPRDEYGRMLYNVLKAGRLNFDTLMRYASRRAVREEMSILLSMMRRRYPELPLPEVGAAASGIEATLEEMVKGASV